MPPQTPPQTPLGAPKEMPSPLPFCVGKTSGEAYPAATPEELDRHLSAPVPAPKRTPASFSGGKDFAIASGLDPNDLRSAGWGVLFGATVSDAIRDALKPLLDWRAQQAEANYRCFDGSQRCREGQSARLWVAEQNGDFQAADPRDGLPFYLLLVADPAEIPFEFQYDLDLNYAVGRLWFDDAGHFARYARSVVEQEQAAAARRPRRIGLVATRHEYDQATQMLHDLVARPLNEGTAAHPPIGAPAIVDRDCLLGPQATKQALLDMLETGDGAPAILFTGSHGLGLDANDPALIAEQGAMVCADWAGGGHGPITASQILAGRDISAAAQVAGMIHFMFACYGGGCPRYDNFARTSTSPAQIADKPFIASLPQALLAHENGSALAVIAHVERAWAYSFLNEFGQPKIAMFRNILTELANGARVGQAVDGANAYWANHSTRLAELQFQAQNDPDIDAETLGAVWIARDDARNMIVLGDPAVRARV
ncbi:Peptidase family C25 [Novosphingobium sp. CF614]|uniref:C25 family cysteine peptidase n=1 Tax=Novosphingobium sp. CF614 TaxID=1884364 RepID=UPI0008EDC4EC|nr:C25 family cysteine peptidase [Novosphingobium sp. CF614]SFG11714.1 Peptidase family C25 [Novosphingobium sp. CF614]